MHNLTISVQSAFYTIAWITIVNRVKSNYCHPPSPPSRYNFPLLSMRQHCHLLLRFYHFWYRPANLVKYPQVKTLQMTWERFTWKWRHQRVWSRFDPGVLSILWTQTMYVVCVKRKLGPAPRSPRGAASARGLFLWWFWSSVYFCWLGCSWGTIFMMVRVTPIHTATSLSERMGLMQTDWKWYMKMWCIWCRVEGLQTQRGRLIVRRIRSRGLTD